MKYEEICPGKPIADTEGKPIHAHAGGLFYENGIVTKVVPPLSLRYV